jgi:hypothetical protein
MVGSESVIMKWKSVKKVEDIALEGIVAEIEWDDNQIKYAILRDSNGKVVKFAQESYSSMRVMVPEPPKTETMWAVKGKIGALEINGNYDSEYDAKQIKDSYERNDSNPSTLVVEQVEVVVED